MGQKSEDFSGSVNSFDFGPIFPGSLGHAISRNAFVVSVYALQKNLYTRVGFFMTPGMTKNHEFSDYIREN